MIIQGTWEEIAALGDKLTGKNVRVTVLITWDKEMRERAAKGIMVLTPAEWLAANPPVVL